jgi:spore coat protein U-like protein
MTTVRSLSIAMVAVALLISARPIAGGEQFPRGLLAGAEPKVGQGRSCTIETRPLSFGIYDALEISDVNAIGQIIYTCTNAAGGGGGGGGGGRGGGGGPPPGRGGGPGAGQTASSGQAGIRIEMAQGSSNSFAPRHMVGLGLASLDYNIYLDATHHQVWGTGEGPTLAYIDANPPNGTPVIVTAFGRIFGGQDVEAGPYGDNVPVRILF